MMAIEPKHRSKVAALGSAPLVSAQTGWVGVHVAYVGTAKAR